MTKQDRSPITGSPADRPGLEPQSLREAAGLSQEEMARLLGMGNYGYSAWERGLRKPGGPVLKLLALIATDPATIIATLRKL